MTATQRRLIAGIVVASSITLALVILDLARGGQPDPPALRAAATLLDGPWRFHTGDDPGWARPEADDSAWDTIDLTAPAGSHDGDVGLPDYVGGWMAQGHSGYHGYAWYRRAVAVPATPASWDLLGPTLVEDGYELFWNGKLLGGSGALGPEPHLVGTRPLRFALPADAAGARGVLAIRTFMRSRSGGYAPDSGGLHSAPILAPRPIGAALHRAQWERTIAGYIADAIEPLAMFALIGLGLWCLPRSGRKGFLLFACLALALAGARRLNNAIVAWTDLQDLATYGRLAKVMWIPTLACWILAWNRWCARPWRIIDLLGIAVTIGALVGTFSGSAVITSASKFSAIAVFVVIAARIVRGGPWRVLASITLALTLAVLFGGELLDPLGVPGIWFPFGIGVSRTQYLYALLIPLLGVVFVCLDAGENSRSAPRAQTQSAVV